MTTTVDPAIMPAAQLARIITDAALFACRDDTLPMINVVRLESSAKRVLAIATDRFTLAASVAQYVDANGHDFTVDLKLPQAQLLARIAKACKGGNVNIATSEAGATFSFSSGEHLTLPNISGPFPEWRKLVEGAANRDDTPAALVGYDPRFMARFGRVTHAYQMYVRVGSGASPTLIKIGDEFFGMIMPVRIVDQATWEQPDWLAKPKPPVAKPKPKRAPRKRTPKTTAPTA